jgi:ABC-type enterochelin transport system permease subunit
MAMNPFLSYIDAGDADPGPALFPRILLILVIVGGLGQAAIASFQAWRCGGFTLDREFELKRLAIPFALVVCVYVYAKALPLVGYLTATVLFAAVGLALIGVLDRSLPSNRVAALGLVGLEAIAITGMLYAVFGYGISVPLP